jgi:hypothetical protein
MASTWHLNCDDLLCFRVRVSRPWRLVRLGRALVSHRGLMMWGSSGDFLHRPSHFHDVAMFRLRYQITAPGIASRVLFCADRSIGWRLPVLLHPGHRLRIPSRSAVVR